mgnify:CR=1 FL=1
MSDNSEDYFSRDVVESGDFDDLCISYITNERNIGSDRNLANCYSIPESEYVMLVGDDDFLEEDFFIKVLPLLKKKSFDLVFFKAFGLTYDSSEKRPKSSGAVVYFNSAKQVLFDRNIHMGKRTQSHNREKGGCATAGAHGLRSQEGVSQTLRRLC